jgi:hypothetical protein
VSVTAKISVSMGQQELRHARRLASRLGLSLSTFITDAVRERIAEQERREAAEAVLASFPPEDRATPEEMADLLDRWRQPAPLPTPAARRRRSRPAPAPAAPTRSATPRPRPRRAH